MSITAYVSRHIAPVQPSPPALDKFFILGMRAKLPMWLTYTSQQRPVAARLCLVVLQQTQPRVVLGWPELRPGSSVLQSYNIEVYYFTGFCNDVLLTGYVPATKNSQFNREENNPRFQHSRDSKCYDSVHLFETLWAGLWYLHAFVLFSWFVLDANCCWIMFFIIWKISHLWLWQEIV